MNRRRIPHAATGLFALCCSVTLSDVAFAFGQQGAQGTELSEKLNDAKAAYDQKQKRSARILNAAFKKALTEVRKSSLPASRKAMRIAELERQQQAFNDHGDLPDSNGMAAHAFDYICTLNGPRLEVKAAYERQIAFWTNHGDSDLAANLAEQLERFEQLLPGRNSLRVRTNWVGARSNPTYSTDVKIWIGHLEGNQIKCHISLDRGDKQLKAEGTIEGNHLRLRQTRMVRGKRRQLNFEGVVLNDKIILKITGIDVRGRPAKGIVLLHRQAG